MNLETFKELLLKQQTSGLSVKAFCVQEQLSMSNWCYWKRKLSQQAPTNKLAPVTLQHNSTAKDQQLAPSIHSTMALMIHLPNGVKVEFGSSDDSVALQMLNTMCQNYVLPE